MEDNYPDLVLGHGCQLEIHLGAPNGSLRLTYARSFEPLPGETSCFLAPTVSDWDSELDFASKIFFCVYLCSQLTWQLNLVLFGFGDRLRKSLFQLKKSTALFLFGSTWIPAIGQGDGKPEIIVGDKEASQGHGRAHDSVWGAW